jgi:predicted ATPase
VATVIANPLRGRQPELASLQDHLARLRSGAGTSWLIEGGPGLGKSRLVECAVSAAQDAGFAVGHGVAEPGDAAVELAALMDALFGGPEPLLQRAALGDSRAHRERRYWLLQDIQTLLEQSALRRPVLICLDDVQWADGGTRAAIRTLPARLASLPVGWVLAFRPVEADSDLGRAAADLLRNGAGHTVLERLDQAAVAEVMADVLGADSAKRSPVLDST